MEMASNLSKVAVSKLGNIPTLGNGEPKARGGSGGSRIPMDRIGLRQTQGPPRCEGASE